MLAVGLRIMPACTGLFMAVAVGAQVTLTAGAWLPQSPDVMAGRGALPPIIPAQKGKQTQAPEHDSEQL